MSAPEDAASDLFADEKPQASSRDFASWYKQMFERLKSGSGPVFMGNGRHFPLNPLFKPCAPVPDAFKERLFALWKSDPSRWTPRQLSGHFKISIDRAMAIIKLKTQQRRMEKEGFPVNLKYVQRMEGHLACAEPAISEASRNLLEDHDPTRHMRPMHAAVPSGTDLSPAQAAALLDRKLAPVISAISADISADMPYDPNPPADADAEMLKQQLFIRHDTDGASRFRYVIVDNNQGMPESERQVVVREADGTLRQAMPVERRLETAVAAKDILTRADMQRMGILPKKR